MNKMVQILPQPPQISMDYAGYVKLGSFWHRRHLTGPFWRFYHHDGRGAGLCVDRKRIEILPAKGPAACFTALQMDIRDSEDIEARLESMRRGIGSLREFKITRATRDYSSNGLCVKKDEFVAFGTDGSAASGETIEDAVEAALRTIEDIEDRESVLIFTGEGFDPEMEESLTERIAEISPMLEPNFIAGGQPVYTVILGVL